MATEVFTMGEEQRNKVKEWYIKTIVDSLKKARFMVVVKAAIEEVTYDYEVRTEDSLSQLERVLYLSYNIAIGNCLFSDVVRDDCGGGSLFKLVNGEKGELAIVSL